MAAKHARKNLRVEADLARKREFIRASLGGPATSTKPYSFERSKFQTGCERMSKVFRFKTDRRATHFKLRACFSCICLPQANKYISLYSILLIIISKE
jgi:hypothetical protein